MPDGRTALARPSATLTAPRGAFAANSFRNARRPRRVAPLPRSPPSIREAVMRNPVPLHHYRVALCLATALGAACADPTALPAPGSDPLLTSALGDPFAVGLKEVAAGLTSPVAIVSAHDGSGRLFIVDQIGLIRVLTADGTLLPEPFLDVRDRMVSLRTSFDERGLLGLAFHPDYETNGRFFVYYNAPPRTAGFDNTDT